jgi:hypothetical protein
LCEVKGRFIARSEGRLHPSFNIRDDDRERESVGISFFHRIRGTSTNDSSLHINQDPKKHGVGEHQSLEQRESLSLTSRTPHEDDEQHLNSKNSQRKFVLHFPPIKALLEIESEIIDTI